MHVVIVGGGIVGMFTAYYLLKDGHTVTIADGCNLEGRASTHNGGLIVPSFSVPSPIGLVTILGTYLGREGPVYVSPREALRNLAWIASALGHGIGVPNKAVAELGAKSLHLYNEFLAEESVDVDLKRGVVGLYKDAEMARKAAQVLDGKFIDELGTFQLGFRGLGGGVVFERELSVNPLKLFNEMKRKLVQMGGRIIDGVANLRGRSSVISSASVNGETLSGDLYVIAAGARSRKLCLPLGFDPQVIPARGLVMTFKTDGSSVVGRPALLEDYGVVVAQYGSNEFAATGFFELMGFDHEFSDSRKKWLLHVLEKHVRGYNKLRYFAAGAGFRPCSPDQKPIIGRVPSYKNLFIATGHCRLGLTLAPGTGDLIRSMIAEEPQDSMSAAFDPARFA